MSNTIIQIKRSTTTAVPPNGSLGAGVPAYSYVSNTMFIGTPDGTGVIAVGGKFYLDTIAAAFVHANQAFDAANTAGAAGAAYAFLHANAAFSQANSASATANAGIATANAAYAYANSAGITANAAFLHANAAYAFANSISPIANLAFVHANNAYAKANAALASTGGTISGDLIITGNVTISGCTTYSNTNTLLVGDNLFVLNADLPAAASPSEDAGMVINRGNQSNVGIIWIEATKQWSMQVNTGISRWLVANSELESTNATAVAAFASANAGQASANAGQATANAAFARANLAHAHANAAFVTANAASATAIAGISTANAAYAFANSSHAIANLAFTHANNAYALANSATAQAANANFLTTGTVPTARLSGSYTGITGVGTIAAGTWQGSTVAVGYGGTGQTSFTTNGILFGNAGGALGVTAAGTEGQVLHASATGIPQFAMLDGGTF